jgi:hypothetical protein
MASVSEEVSKLIDKGIELELELKFKNLINFYVKKLQNYLVNFIQGSVNSFRDKLGVRASISYNVSVEGTKVRVLVDAEIPPDEVDRIRKAFYKKWLENKNIPKLRIDAIYRLISSELEKVEGEESGVLPNMYSGTGKGEEEVGGG